MSRAYWFSRVHARPRVSPRRSACAPRACGDERSRRATRADSAARTGCSTRTAAPRSFPASAVRDCATRCDRGADHDAGIRRGRQPAEPARAILRRHAVGHVRLDHARRAATRTLDDPRHEQQPIRVRVREHRRTRSSTHPARTAVPASVPYRSDTRPQSGALTAASPRTTRRAPSPRSRSRRSASHRTGAAG